MDLNRGRSSRILFQLSIPDSFCLPEIPEILGRMLGCAQRVFLHAQEIGPGGSRGHEERGRQRNLSLFWAPAYGKGFFQSSATSPGCARAPQGYEILGFLPRCLLLVWDVPASHRASAPPGASRDAAKEEQGKSSKNSREITPKITGKQLQKL